MLFGELENFFKCRNSLPGEFAAKPGPRVQLPQIGQRQLVYCSLAVGRTVHGGIVNSDKTRISGELQVRLDKTHAHGHSAAKGCKSILGRVTGSTAVCNRKQLTSPENLVCARGQAAPPGFHPIIPGKELYRTIRCSRTYGIPLWDFQAYTPNPPAA